MNAKLNKNSNEAIIQEIIAAGYITEKQIQLFKNRSNKAQERLFHVSEVEDKIKDRIHITTEQGVKGLAWLKKFISKKDPHKVIGGAPFGFRETEIINNANPNEFYFCGFYDAGGLFTKNYVPVYGLGGMQYYVLGGKPYLVA